MALSREAIFSALFARLRSNTRLAALVKTYTRRAVGVENYSIAQQPLLVLEAGDQSAETQEGVPPIWTLAASIVVFARAPSDPSTSPESVLLDIVDAAEAALEMGPNESTGFPYGGRHTQTTLGGLVRLLEIERVEMFAAEPGGQEQQAAVLSLRMVAI